MFTCPSILNSLKKLVDEERNCIICPDCGHSFSRNSSEASTHTFNNECSRCGLQIITLRTYDPKFDHILQRLTKEFIIPLEEQLTKHSTEIAKEVQITPRTDISSARSTPTSMEGMQQQQAEESSIHLSEKAVASLLISLPSAVVEAPMNSNLGKNVLSVGTKRHNDAQIPNSRGSKKKKRNKYRMHQIPATCRRTASVPRKPRKKGVKRKSFEERFNNLLEFKAAYGHFNVPKTKSSEDKYHSLAVWCDNIRQSYRRIEKGEMPRQHLSQEHVQRLEAVGFQWRLQKEYLSFNDRFKDLMTYKAENGHCNVPQRRARGEDKYRSLGKWCSDIRRSYRALQDGSEPSSYKGLTMEQIKKLDNEGFRWSYKNI